jgi:hypothetical protein
MTTPAMNTILKMLEDLPEPAQSRVAEHLRDYLAELRDEEKWETSYSRTQPKLTAAARRARKEIAEGKTEPMDFNRL